MAPDDSRTLTVEEVLRVLWRLLPPLTLGTLGLYLVLWGWPAASAGEWVRASLLMLAVYLGAVIVHEILHIIPMLFVGIRISELRIGVRWKDGVVYVHGGRPVSATAYRVILATPGIILGIIPAVYGIATGHAFLTVFAWLMLVSAVGDWAVLRLIRDLPGDTLVQDHDSEVGCVIVRPETPPE
ncbi:MAG: DUF3267 domain-containing protein [Rhodothermales bacterium]|nr:DUF3267 domain-containing protein [Rhodothermales bacterium]